VLFAHFGPDWGWSSHVSIGYLGVELFFVLSGFLITSILLGDAEAIESRRQTLKIAFGRFYARRALRIFPTYYLTIAFALVAGLGMTKQSFPWFASYLSNVYVVAYGPPGASTHLWSLAVEEQFYLLWPAIIFLVPRRFLMPVLVAIFAAGLIFRHWCTLAYCEYLLPTCIDYLAAGAALALTFAWFPARAPALLRAGLLAGVGLLIAAFVAGTPHDWNLFNTSALALSVWLVGTGYAGFGGLPGRVLAARPVVYTGRISYGIYLFHNFFPESVGKLLRFFELDVPSRAVLAPLYLVLTFAFASASWHFIEAPLRRFRHMTENRWLREGERA
jgi:peptidoglycan/LPS O-acetylase OafA/YrhL